MSDLSKAHDLARHFERMFGDDVLAIFAKIQMAAPEPALQKALVSCVMGACIGAMNQIDDWSNPAKYRGMSMIDYYDEIFTGMKASQELHEKRKAVIDKLKETTPHG